MYIHIINIYICICKCNSTFTMFETEPEGPMLNLSTLLIDSANAPVNAPVQG